MPAIYAHWLLGDQVLERLERKEKDLILENRAAFNLGLQGPDFTFFKDMGGDKTVSGFGNLLHDCPAAHALTELAKAYKRSKDSSALAYLLGFIGHFALDTKAHGYVYQVVDTDGVDHNALETEFDRHLMEREGLKPLGVKVENLIRLDQVDLSPITALYGAFGKVSEDQLVQAFVDFYKYKKLIRQVQTRIPFLISPALKVLKKEDLYGIFMTKEANPGLKPYMASMDQRFTQALEIYPYLMDRFLDFLDGQDLDPYFDRNFVRIGEKDR